MVSGTIIIIIIIIMFSSVADENRNVISISPRLIVFDVNGCNRVINAIAIANDIRCEEMWKIRDDDHVIVAKIAPSALG